MNLHIPTYPRFCCLFRFAIQSFVSSTNFRHFLWLSLWLRYTVIKLFLFLSSIDGHILFGVISHRCLQYSTWPEFIVSVSCSFQHWQHFQFLVGGVVGAYPGTRTALRAGFSVDFYQLSQSTITRRNTLLCRDKYWRAQKGPLDVFGEAI